MPNLGSSNTPVEGQSFGLPAGAELGEDNGDVVIKDSTGTIILRRNETASEWQFEGTDLTGINSIDASSATLDQLNTPPTGSLVTLSGDQTVANDTLTKVEWDTETSRGEVSGLLNTTDNVVVVPSGYTHAKVSWGIHWLFTCPGDVHEVRVNGSFAGGIGGFGPRDGGGYRNISGATAWFSVSQHDEIEFRVRHQKGSSEDIDDDNGERTYMEVRLI